MQEEERKEVYSCMNGSTMRDIIARHKYVMAPTKSPTTLSILCLIAFTLEHPGQNVADRSVDTALNLSNISFRISSEISRRTSSSTTTGLFSTFVASLIVLSLILEKKNKGFRPSKD